MSKSHKQHRPRRTSGWSTSRLAPVAWLTFCLLLAGGFWWLGTSGWAKPDAGHSASAAAPQTLGKYVTKPIREIEVGDLVLARDEHGNDVRRQRVAEVYRRTSDHLRILTFRDMRGDRQTLRTTNEHPFWAVRVGQFVAAKDLVVGEEVVGPRGERQHLVATVYEAHPDGIPVYNFQVEEYHTYCVREGGTQAAPVLVHNADYDDLDDLVPSKVPTAELVPTHRLKVRYGRAKTDYDALKADIRANGIKEPIKYVEHGGNKYIVDGHHRLRAAQELGIKDVPAQKVDLPYGGYQTPDDLLDYFNNPG